MRMELKIENITEHLKTHGIKPSYQRLKIYEYLVKHHNHPTVDMIHRELSPLIPTLSKTTIYNTLSLFIEKKIAALIVIEENETRYDADTSIHGHFKCRGCSRLFDLEVDLSKIKIPMLKEHQVSEYHFYFKGLCKECK